MVPAATETRHHELAARFALAVGRLSRNMRRVHASSGLSPSQLSALYLIGRDGPLRVGDLAELEGVSSPTMTRVLDVLERAGLVSRSVDPHDRRQMLVALTDEGASFLKRARSGKHAYLSSRLAELAPHELDLLEQATGLIERLVEEDRGPKEHA